MRTWQEERLFIEMKCPVCKTKMKIEINDKSDATLWYLCDCWYCKSIHHPVRNLLNWLDKSWYKRHKQIIKTRQPNKPDIVDTFSLEELERRTISKVLSLTKGNFSEAARKLKIGRTTLYRKAKKYKII